MDAVTAVRTVFEALSEVERWGAAEEARHSAEIVEVDQELDNLRGAIANLEQQLTALNKFKAELEGKSQSLPDRRLDRAHRSLFEALQDQYRLLAAREAEVNTISKSRDTALEGNLKGTSVAGLVEEYRQYKMAVEPNLRSLPESYRSVVSQHHVRISERLREYLQNLAMSPVQIQADVLTVEVVYCVDAPEGNPELLVVVVPVADEVHTGWHGRGDGLQGWLSCRVVQAIYQAARASGFVRAHAMSGGHLGLLAIEVDLVDAPPTFLPAFEERLTAVLTNSPELLAAQVNAQPQRVDVDFVLPPEEDAGA